MATANYGWTELDLDDEPNVGQVNVPLNQIDASLKRILDERDAARNAAWTPYTPAWQTGGTNLAINNGSIAGRWRRHGSILHGDIRLVRGSETHFGDGTYDFGLPVNARSYLAVAGGGWMRDASSGTHWALTVRGISTGKFRCIHSGNSYYTSKSPVAPDTNDDLYIWFYYEVS